MKLATRVRAGITFLDGVYGHAWRKKINLETLRLDYSNQCVLGQIDNERNYAHHEKRLGISERLAFELGFSAYHPLVDRSVSRDTWYRLTRAWKRGLRAIGIR